MVEERSPARRSEFVKICGEGRSENVSLSNENLGENPRLQKPKVSFARFVHEGLVST